MTTTPTTPIEVPRDRWCKKCQRASCGHESRYPAAIDRLLAKVRVNGDGCWIYQGALCNGYARLRGDSRRKVFGHRLAWEHFVGPITDGLTYDHLCEVRACVNPGHGELVPMLVNIRRASRGMATANRAKTHCPLGHPLSGDNLVPSAPGRVCRECRKETNRRYRARRAGKVAA